MVRKGTSVLRLSPETGVILGFAFEVLCAFLKLALVDRAALEDYYPAGLTVGVQKRLGVAPAMALDLVLFFFVGPPAWLDPISSGLLHELIVDRQESLGPTVRQCLARSEPR